MADDFPVLPCPYCGGAHDPKTCPTPRPLLAPPMRLCRTCEVWHDGPCETRPRPRSVVAMVSLAMVVL